MEFDFGAMLEKHRRDRRRAWLLTLLLLVLGLGVVAVAWRIQGGSQLWMWAGGLVAALCVVPMLDALDRSDRIAALERLRGAWAQVSGLDGPGTAIDRLRRIIRSTHGVASS